MAYMGRLCLKGVSFSGVRYMKGQRFHLLKYLKGQENLSLWGSQKKNFVAVKKSKKCSGCVFYKKEPNNDVRECSFCYCRSFVAIFWYQVGNNQDYYKELLCIFKTNCHLYYQNVHQKKCCHGNKAKEKGYIQGSRKFYLKNSGPSRN